jgi:glycerate 2-kinase
MKPDLLLTNTLRRHANGTMIAGVLAAALQAVDPAVAVRKALRRQADTIWIADQAYAITPGQQVVVVAIGKAGAPMARAAAEALGDCISRIVVVVKDGHGEAPTASIETYEAGHPVPDQRSLRAATRVLQCVAGLTADDLVIVLLSGGGSALMALPVAGVSLADMQQLTKLLLGCGAGITEINTLRKHLEQTKGGGLARAAGAARIAALVLSDVVGDPLDVIASGPTYPDPTTYHDAYALLEHYQILQQVPPPIVDHLRSGMAGVIPETLKPHDPQVQHIQHTLVGNNRIAALAGKTAAEQAGMQACLLTTRLQGEARLAAGFLAAIMQEAAISGNPLARPGCLIAGGETTVTLHGNGRGGRNQELALALVAPLAGLRDIVAVALATDGGDGPTDAAGAVVSGDTQARAEGLGLRASEYLERNDAYRYFAALDDLLKPGPTRTNVNDLFFGFIL